jgi:nitronate monooxygenase
MAGGPTTPALVVAAGEAGALGFLAGGYQTAAALGGQIDTVRAATSGPFGVNVFVPGHPADDPAAVQAYLGALEPEADRLATALGAPMWDDDDYADKLELLLDTAPAMVSFTFGCPPTARWSR